MRIVHFIDTLRFGGLQTVVMGLALAQKERGHFVEIACLHGPGKNVAGAAAMERAGIKVVGPFQTRWLITDTVSRIRNYVKDQKFDIVHSHNPLSTHFVTAGARLARVPTLNTLHATALFPLMKRTDRAIFWGASIFTHRIVSVCREVQTILRDRFPLPAGKLKVVENGIDLTRFLEVPRRPIREEVVFGAIGRMTPVKNHRMLIEAFAQLHTKYPETRLRILGGGPLEAELRDLANGLSVGDRVELCGFSPDVPRFLGEIDVFALSSNSEGLPMSMLEAIASGLPVVSTRVGGVPDVLQKSKSGWLSEPGDVQGFMAAMESAMQCPDRVQLGEKSRWIVADMYSSERMSIDYERVYESIL